MQELLERDFSTGAVEPITVLSERPPTDALPQRMIKLRDVEEMLPIDKLPPTVAGYKVDPLGSDDGERAQQLVRDIRALDPSLLVGGPAAELIDAKDSTRQRLPLALAVVFLPTALLLFALTRSVLVPLKAIVLNLLTLLATLGVLVLLFPGPLDITTPLLLFMFIFGLSMDYEVFLLARIKEEWDRTRRQRPRGARGHHRDRPGRDAGGALDRHRLRRLRARRAGGGPGDRRRHGGRRAARRHGGPRPAAARRDVAAGPLELVAWNGYT